jgi:hypothetical protein
MGEMRRIGELGGREGMSSDETQWALKDQRVLREATATQTWDKLREDKEFPVLKLGGHSYFGESRRPANGLAS